MNRTDTLTRLRTHADAVRAMGATALYLFGSAASNEKPPRDIDLFIDYDTSRSFSLLDLVGIKQFLEEQLNTEVDITTRDSLHPILRRDIEQSAIRVF